ncbi:MAG: hypothetical protein IKZ87_04130 [Actinomycetaceae bacterium]|nr:hypothetical protein [Actinomycetaceae bacterium]
MSLQKLFNNLGALERAWDTLCTLPSERPKQFQDINSALVLSADRIEFVYNELRNIELAYIKPLLTNDEHTTKDHWIQCVIALADELGNAIQVIFQEVGQKEEVSPPLAEALAECYMLAGIASAALVAYNIGDEAVACGNNLKKKLDNIDVLDSIETTLGIRQCQ